MIVPLNRVGKCELKLSYPQDNFPKRTNRENQSPAKDAPPSTYTFRNGLTQASNKGSGG
jgi:hypothetical protein